MSKGDIVGLSVGGLVVAGVVFFAVHRQAKAAAAVANASAAAAANATKAKGSPYDVGDLLANLGGALAVAGATYFSGGATAFNARVDGSKSVMI
jgi:hypothetical protein